MKREDTHAHRRDEHGVVHAIPFGSFPTYQNPECVGPPGEWQGRVSTDVPPTCLICIGSRWTGFRPP